MSLYGGVDPNDVRGMRAPFLQTGGNTMFEMLKEANFTYDSSMPVYDIEPPLWPYTLDYSINHDCMIEPCPTSSIPGLSIYLLISTLLQSVFHFRPLGSWHGYVGGFAWGSMLNGRRLLQSI